MARCRVCSPIFNKEFHTLYDMLQRLADVLLRPFGYTAFVWPGPSRGCQWFDHERQRDPDALFLWLGSVHVVIDRGER